MSTKIVALIPARAGSTRLPGKNLLEIGGQSLVARAVRCAVQVRELDVIVVSSDSQAVLDEAFAETADSRVVLHERSPALSTAEVGVEPLMREIMGAWPTASHLVLLNPTSPFRRPETVRRCIETALDGGWDTVATVAQTTVPSYLWTRGEGGLEWVPPHAGSDRPRSQDVEPSLHEHGACYVVSRDNVMRGTLTGGACCPFETDPVEAIDIDTAQDLAAARGVLEWVRGAGEDE